MKLISCVDDNYGLLFFKKRVSKDSKIIEDIFSLNEKLSMNEYSYKMFCDYGYLGEIIISEYNIENTYFFNEVNTFENNKDIEVLILYKFNRSYPSDIKLKIELDDYILVETMDFIGSSHEKITREKYIKEVGNEKK